VAYRHLLHVMAEQVERLGDRVALRHRLYGSWEDISWRQFGERVRSLASSLIELGVAEGEMVGIFSGNRPEWTIADFACLVCRAVPVPIYPTSTVKQAEYIVRDAGIRTLFVGGREQLEKARELLDRGGPLARIVVFDDSLALDDARAVHFSELVARGRGKGDGEEVRARLARASLDDLLTVIYTSGTTGEPKGVMLTHANIAFTAEAHDRRLLDPNPDDVSMCFLPLSHVFERAWTYYALSRGMTVCYCDEPTKIIEYLQQARPTIMCAVPRFYEKIYATILQRVATASPLRRRLFRWAIAVGDRHGRLRKDEAPIPLGLRLRHAVADALVLKKLRAIVGGRIKFFPCAGAPLAQEIEEFFHAAGIFICYGYGLTETTATVTCHETRHYRFGTVGRPLPGVEVRIGANDEILVRGPIVMKGYYKKPEATAEVLVDGWFRTGDAGVLDEDGLLRITDRIKDLMKTAGGKYVAPQLIESLIGSDLFVEQVAVIGDGRPYVTALVVPSFPALEEWARGEGLAFSSRQELLALPEVRELFRERIDEHTKDLARFEKIKTFTLLPSEFTVAGGEITPTLKVKRRAVEAKYRDVIEAMYAHANQW